MMARVRILVVALLLAAPLGAAAVDEPHASPLGCSNCHLGHNAPGGALTSVNGNFNLCQSCHTNPQYTGRFGFPWVAGDQAVPGTSGTSHSWSAPATNLGATAPSAGSADPAEAVMARHLAGGNLQCSTCHDPHQADLYAWRGTQHAAAVTKAQGSGTGTLTLGTPAAAAAPKGYRIRIVLGGAAGTATFQVSNDNGASWFGWNGASWEAGNANGRLTGSAVQLTDGANVTVTFAGATAASFVGGATPDTWSFYVSYPFLQADNTDGRMCVTCHRDRDQRWQDVEGGTGMTVFSHPVDQALNANGKGYDRAAPVDVNGLAQGTDGNSSNDLVLSATGKVTCLTCHHPHNADSNSLTPDAR